MLAHLLVTKPELMLELTQAQKQEQMLLQMPER
jgi:hypothetical protein